ADSGGAYWPLFFVLLTSGARGPLIASVLGAFVPLAFSIQFRGLESRIRIRMVVAFFALFLAGGIMAVWGGPESTTIQSLSILFNAEGGGKSAAGRLQSYKQSTGIIARAPFVGHGVGGWPVVAGLGDVPAYPHNIFIETLSESGFVGFVLLLGCFG